MKPSLLAVCVVSVLFAADWGGDVRPVEVARFPSYTEGVVVDHAGNLYVSHASQISKVTPGGQVSVWATTVSPNGHKVLADGTHLVCDRKGAVYLLDAAGRTLRTMASPQWGANDICLDTANGGFYFTSPYGSRGEPVGTLHYVDARGTANLAAGKLGYPNGLVLRPDGKTLLVGESQRNRIIEFPVLAPGKVGKFRVFAELPQKGPNQLDAKPDGMTLDAEGNLYVAHYGMGQVQVLDPRGRLLRSLPGGGIFTSNVAFAGPKMSQLYVTGSIGPAEQTTGLLTRLDLPWVQGLRILPARK